MPKKTKETKTKGNRNFHPMWIFLVAILGFSIGVIYNNIWWAILFIVLGVGIFLMIRKPPSQVLEWNKSNFEKFAVWFFVITILVVLTLGFIE